MSEIDIIRVEMANRQKQMADAVKEAFPIGSVVKTTWMHESNPKCEVLNVSHDGYALHLKLLEPVQHRIRSKGIFHPVGYTFWRAANEAVRV